VKPFECGFDSIIADAGINLGGTQVGVAEQFLNGANIRSAFQQVSSEAMTQHLGADHSKPSTPADLLHDPCERTARQWPIRFDADEVHTLQKPFEFDLCCRIRHILRIAEPFAVMESVDAVISPMSNPCFFVIGDMSLLLRNDVLEQIPAPPSAQILAEGAGSWQTEIDDTLLAFRSHWYPTACKVNVLDADHGHLTDAAACRVEQFNQCSVSRIRGSP